MSTVISIRADSMKMAHLLENMANHQPISKCDRPMTAYSFAFSVCSNNLSMPNDLHNDALLVDLSACYLRFTLATEQCVFTCDGRIQCRRARPCSILDKFTGKQGMY